MASARSRGRRAYLCSLLVLVVYVVVHVTQTDEDDPQAASPYLALGTSATLLVLDLAVFLMYRAKQLNSPGATTGALVFSRVGIISFGGRYGIV